MNIKQRDSSLSHWKKWVGKRYAIFDAISLITGGGLIILWSQLSFPSLLSASAWAALLFLYFVFYRRLALIVYWSWDTYRMLKRSHTMHESYDLLTSDDNADCLPRFQILVASYRAQDSIASVLDAAANQRYPKHLYSSWVITESREKKQNDEWRDSVVIETTDLLKGRKDPRVCSSESARLAWVYIRSKHASLLSWLNGIAKGELGLLTGYQEAVSWLAEDLVNLHSDGILRTGGTAEEQESPPLTRRETTILERIIKKRTKTKSKVLAEFRQILGRASFAPEEAAGLPIRGSFLDSLQLRRVAKKILRSAPSIGFTSPQGDLESEIMFCARDLFPSTQDAVIDWMHKNPEANVYHLDPLNRGYKPGALNVAFYEMRQSGHLDDPANTYFIIVDSDSLLCERALQACAFEILREDRIPQIYQMVSIPTANFYSGGWYSRFVSLLDAVGAVGKWARSVRRQVKPDLHAGSGVVIPAVLMQFLEGLNGKPWDENTLTEDARLIVGQYGMMDRVTNRTQPVPSYLLEAVPEDGSFVGTYRRFWNQRSRWATGGYDETLYMWQAPDRLVTASYDKDSGKWTLPGKLSRVQIRLARMRRGIRIISWIWDHFVWGIGGFLVLTHWTLLSAIYSPTEQVFWIGLVLLIATPALILTTAGSALRSFVPGGVSRIWWVELYFHTFVGVWLYIMPVFVTQIACLVGLRRLYRG